MANLENVPTTEQINKKANVVGLSIPFMEFLMVTSQNDKGNSFVTLKNYKNKGNGQISDHKINTSFNYANAQAKDLRLLKETYGDINTYFETFKSEIKTILTKKLKYLSDNNAKAVTIAHFTDKLNGNEFTKELMIQAYTNTYNSVVKVGDLEFNSDIAHKQSDKSKAKAVIFEHINGIVKFHRIEETLYIKARKESVSNLTTKGKLNETKNGAKVIAQDLFKRGFKSLRYRDYIVGRADFINAFKHQFQGAEIQS